jgi:hypothetical protein
MLGQEGRLEQREGRGGVRNVFDDLVVHDPRPFGATPYFAGGDFLVFSSVTLLAS